MKAGGFSFSGKESLCGRTIVGASSTVRQPASLLRQAGDYVAPPSPACHSNKLRTAKVVGEAFIPSRHHNSGEPVPRWQV